MNYLLLSKNLGMLVASLSLPMVFPIGWAIWYEEHHSLMAFLGSIAVALACGGVLYAAGRRARPRMYERESIALVGLGWLLVAGFGGLPYVFSGLMTPAEAYFETMSGFTTTGASVLADVESVDRSLLFWRALTHWLGGMGIIVLLIAVLPFLGAGGKQLYRSEVPGVDKSGLMPRIQDTAALLYKIYLGMTVAQTALLMLAGMDLFDALCHTFASLSTGGFSTRNSSVAAFDSLAAEIIIIFFMVVAGANFGIYFAMLKGDWKAPFRNTELKWYLIILAAATLLIAVNLTGVQGTVEADKSTPGAMGAREYGFGHALRVSAFQVSTIMTTTGFATDDSNLWPYFSRALLVMLMIIGACSGSTAGGTKVVRVVILAKMVWLQLEKLFRPKTVRVLRVNGAVVPPDVQHMVHVFFVIHMSVLIAGTVFMSGLGLPFQTALTSVVATVNNIGPGMELVGAAANYSFVPDAGKWFLSLMMVMGRLEFFSICVLFIPAFWKRA